MEYLTKIENGIGLTKETSIKIAEFERAIAKLKTEEETLKEKILFEMEENNILKLDTDDLTITYIAPTYRETFDSKKLKADDENTYNKYIKISDVKSSIRIKLK